ncbi:MAG TPA: MFS transporter [Gallionellaceae bacterium]|nr:MFS transporter [Gallionellaceae bacterium]
MARVWVLALGAFALGTDLFVIAGILPQVAREMGVTVAAAGWLVSSFAFTYAPASPVLAVLTGNLPRRKLLLASLGIFCVANAISALSPSYVALLLSRVLAALGAALYMPTASSIVATLAVPEKRARSLSMVTAGLTAAIVLGVPLGTWIAEYAGWRATFWFVAVLAAGALLVIRLWIPDVPALPPVGWRVRLALLRQPRVAIALAMIVLWTAGGFAVYPYLSALLIRVTHLTLADMGWIFLLFGVASVAGNFVGGHSADKRGATPTIIFGLVLMFAVLSTLSWSATHLVTVIPSVAAWGMAAWMLNPPQQHRLIACAPQIPAAVLGLNGSALYLGMGIGAGVGAEIMKTGNFNVLGRVGGSFELLALLLLAGSAMWEQRRAAAQRI